MATIIDELISRLGFDITGKENLRDFKRGMSDAQNQAQGFAGSITQLARGVTTGMAAVGVAVKGATAGMFALANSAAGPLDEMVKLADRTGETVEAIQELNFVAEQGGASASAMQSAIETMSRRLAQAARGAGAARTALEEYGISAVDAEGNVRRATDVMAELSDRFQDMDQGQRLDIARALGIDMRMVSVLAQGNDEIERLRQVARDAGLIFTDEDARNAEAYNDAMNLLMRTVRSMRDRIAIDLIPTLMAMIGGMQDWFNANREVIQQNVGAFLGRMARHASTLSTAFQEFADKGGKAFYVTLAAIAAVARPFLARMIVLAFILDELLTWWEGGGETFMGRFSEYLQSWGISEGFADGLTTVAAALAIIAALNPRAVWAVVRGIGGLVAGAAGLKAIGAGAVFTGVGTGISGIAAISAGKLLLVVGAMWGLYRAAESISKVPFDWIDKMLGLDPARLDKVDTSTGAIVDRITERIRSAAPKPSARSDQAAAPGEIPQYGRQTAAESISVPASSMNHRQAPTIPAPPPAMGTMSGEDFRAITGTMTDNRDQSTNVDVGGINVTVPPGSDGNRMGQEAADALRRALTVHGTNPATP